MTYHNEVKQSEGSRDGEERTQVLGRHRESKRQVLRVGKLRMFYNQCRRCRLLNVLNDKLRLVYITLHSNPLGGCLYPQRSWTHRVVQQSLCSILHTESLSALPGCWPTVLLAEVPIPVNPFYPVGKVNWLRCIYKNKSFK